MISSLDASFSLLSVASRRTSTVLLIFSLFSLTALVSTAAPPPLACTWFVRSFRECATYSCKLDVVIFAFSPMMTLPFSVMSKRLRRLLPEMTPPK